MASRSSLIFRLTVSVLACSAIWVFGAVRISAFFTYCWVSVEPPCTDLCSRSLTRARNVPLMSMAPCW